jgi:hypothetical protein
MIVKLHHPAAELFLETDEAVTEENWSTSCFKSYDQHKGLTWPYG